MPHATSPQEAALDFTERLVAHIEVRLQSRPDYLNDILTRLEALMSAVTYDHDWS